MNEFSCPPEFLNGYRDEDQEGRSNRKQIELKPGALTSMVDDVDRALTERGPANDNERLYTRGGLIVCLSEVKDKDADHNDISVQAFVEKPDAALLEDVDKVCMFTKFDARAKCNVEKDPPRNIPDLLKARAAIGRLNKPLIKGIINTPQILANGRIIWKKGYDQQTALLYDPLGIDFDVPENPTKDNAYAAAWFLMDELFGEFPLDDVSKSVALSGLLSACSRYAYRHSILHAHTAPRRQTGKSKLVNIYSMVATGRPMAAISNPASEEELEKKLNGLLLRLAQLASVDNISRPLESQFLCQCLTEDRVTIRILHTLNTPEVESRMFLCATGNNLQLYGDLCARAIMATLDAKMEHPEERTFKRLDPVIRLQNVAFRVKCVRAVLTILLAYKQSREKVLVVTHLNSQFQGWSEVVREAILWLGYEDPMKTVKIIEEGDRDTVLLRRLIPLWKDNVGGKVITAGQLLSLSQNVIIWEKDDVNGASLNGHHQGNEAEPKGKDKDKLRELLAEICLNAGKLSPVRLGTWLGRHAKGIPVDGYRICGTSNSEWQLRDLNDAPYASSNVAAPHLERGHSAKEEGFDGRLS
jgi:putative DNA primase/helicase